MLTANLLPVVRYVPVFHPSEANELINLPLTPSPQLSIFTPLPPEWRDDAFLAGSNKTKEGNFDKKSQKNSKYSLFASFKTRQSEAT